MHENMFSYLNIYKMKLFDLHAFLLNSLCILPLLSCVAQPLHSFSQQVLFWSRGSFSRVLEGADFSFKSIDPKLAN